MDTWGSILLVLNILLLTAGWLLFQQAKSDLTARAAEAPVLNEIRSLQKGIARLLEQLKLESDQMSVQLEVRCADARELLHQLERALEGAGRQRVVRSESPARDETDSRLAEVYRLAEAGGEQAVIAEQTGIPEGEVELILKLRARSG